MDLIKSLRELRQSLEPLGKENGFFRYRVLWLGIIGILLIAFSSAFNGDIWGREESGLSVPKAAEGSSAAQLNTAEMQDVDHEAKLEAKLVKILSRVKGAGQVQVSIRFAGSERQEYARNKVNETKTVQEKDTAGGVRTTTESKESEQFLVGKETGSDKPIVIETMRPEVKGVLIVAEGAANSTVKANLTKAVEAGLGIPSYKITVLPQ